MVSAGLQLNERLCASFSSFFLFFSLFSSCVFMTVPIFSERVWFARLPTASSIPLQRFDVRCDWLSLIYRRPGSVNFKLTDKESTATIRTHRFFPPVCRRRSSFSPKMAITQQSFKSVLAGGHKRLVACVEAFFRLFLFLFHFSLSLSKAIAIGFISRLHCSIRHCSPVIEKA